MNSVETGRETIEACLAHLRRLEGIEDVDFTNRDRSLPAGADAKLTLRTRAGRFVYIVEIKRVLTRAGLEHVIQQLQRYAKTIRAKPLLLADYVSPNIAERLIAARVNFADTAGNVYLDWPGKLHIQIQGKKPTLLAEAKSERLTQPSGLRILYALLTQAAENWGTYRDIAKATGLALGSIAVVMRELKAKGYLVEKKRDEWRLTQRLKLLDLWVEGYAARLRPDLVIGRYQPSDASLDLTLQSLRSELEAGQISWALTGGFAAGSLTHHFRGEQLCFYAQDWPVEITRKLKWLPSERGPVTVLRKFSPLVEFLLESPESQPIAHPLLVYAELIFQGRERELETAKIVYDRYLTPLVSNDAT